MPPIDDGNLQASEVSPSFDEECFFITPIGSADSDERKRSDGLLQAVVEPSAGDLGLTPIRADKIEKGGHITLQVLEHCVNAKAAVADVTGGNLNVYYEVGIRHALRQPLVILADESERGRLPFDLLQQRTVFYTDDMAGAATCRKAVTEQLRSALDGHVDSPVQAAANLRSFQEGDAVQQTLADLVGKVEILSSRVGRSTRRGEVHPRAVSDLLEGLSVILESGAVDEAEPHIRRGLETLSPAVDHLIRQSGYEPRSTSEEYAAELIRSIFRQRRLDRSRMESDDEEGLDAPHEN